jgi:hypothetical protein
MKQIIHLGNLIFYEKEVNIDNRSNNCFKITNTINSAFIRQKILKETRIKLYNTIDFAALSYNSENLTVEARDGKRIAAAEMKYRRNTAG